MKDYKLVHEDDHLMHLRHPNGNTFAIAKKAVGPKMVKQIQTLCGGGEVQKFADGGEVSGDVIGSLTPNVSQIAQNMNVSTVDPKTAALRDNYNQIAKGYGAGSDQLFGPNGEAPKSVNTSALDAAKAATAMSDKWQANSAQRDLYNQAAQDTAKASLGLSSPVVPTSPVAGAPADPGPAPAQPPQAAQVQGQPQSLDMTKLPGYADQLAGIKGSAGAAMQLGKDQQGALGSYQTAMDTTNHQFEARRQAIDQEQSHLQQQLMEGKIDPNRVWTNKSAGQKVSAVIGLILGGIGSGLTHGPNAAQQILDKQVDNDIDAQKAQLGKTHTLLSLNMEKYKNLDQAETATRLQLNTTLQTQLQAAQARAGSSQAAANLNLALGQLKQQGAMLTQTLAAQQAQNKSLGVGTGEGGLPVGGEPASLLRDPKYRETRVVVGNKAFQAGSKDDAEVVKNVEVKAQPVLDGVKELSDLAKDPTVKIPGSPANLRAHGIMGQLHTDMPLLAGVMVGAKRVNSEEIKAQADRLQDPTSFMQSLGSAKTQELFRNIERERDAIREQHLIGYRGMNSISSFQPASGKLPMNK